MRITETTRISELIKENKEAIEALASVAKPFYRLRNPVLRRVMAPRVSIVEAAKMGGTTIEAIAAALSPLGFIYEKETPAKEKSEAKPLWVSQALESDICTYDVRPIIESGTDPLKAILNKFKEVPGGGILCIINSFVPTPLIHLLKQEKAEESYVEIISPEESHTYFLKKNKEQVSHEGSKKQDKVFMDDAATFQSIFTGFPADKVREIDVRHLEMPGPMQTILGELEILPADHVLYVNHKRVPVYLLEELADKVYEVHIHSIDDKNVKMILFRKS